MLISAAKIKKNLGAAYSVSGIRSYFSRSKTPKLG